MLVCTGIIIVLPFVLIIGLYLKSALLFEKCSFIDLIFSKEWKPWENKFGFAPFIICSLWVSILALLLSAPVCLLTAIYLTHYAKSRVLKIMQPVIDILAGIPSVIYGVWGILVIVPFVAKLGNFFGIHTTGYTILSGALVLSVMIIPFILNVLIEILRTIPEELSEASLSLGATKWETIKYVIIKKAFTGIISAFGLGLSRAFGETIAVLMVVGNVVKIPQGVFDAGYPLPALIANNYGEMLSIPMYDSALMMAALILLVIVILFNTASRMYIYRLEKYR
ncbi:MAG: phosphate ABC transporter permease subunit PstC [Bacteroidia bacterium]|nr:phosphate ABC transporter permease subunit PstC [Bacteroidia bacterium]